MTQDELYHYGVLGMKWGKRKAVPVSATRSRYDTTKAAYKSAKKQYKKDFNKAYNKNYQTLSPFKKSRQASEDRWAKAIDSADKLNQTKKEYKDAKKEYKQTDEYKNSRNKKIAVGAAVAGTALAAYGAYKISKVIKSKQYNRGLEVYKELSSRENSRLYEQAKNSLAYKTQNNLTGRGMAGGKYGRFDYNRNADGSTSMRYVANKLPSANELRELGKKGINKYRRK